MIYSVSTGLLWQGSPEFYHFAYEQLPKRHITKIWQEELNPARNGGHDVFTIEGDRYFTKRAIASILCEPAVYLWYCLQKAVYLWLGNPISDWPHHAMFNVQAMRKFFSPQRIVGILASRILPVFAALGMIVLRHRWREFLPLLAVCGYFTLIHALTGSLRLFYFDPCAHLCRSSPQRATAPDFGDRNRRGGRTDSASVEVN
ncbi:MAG: hypothetical protein EAZ10_03450 [Oscillatoriales cyanobacterium]|nr:MAG: hypothetical protein EAZ10_03450 [Oscillatoriales cyanobacterium]